MRTYNISFKEGDERRKTFLLGGNQSGRRESERGRGERDSQTETERARETEVQRGTESHGDHERR